MSSKLVIAAVSGLAIGTACLIAAAMVGGTELRNHDWNFGDWDGKACNLTLANRRGTRTLDWHAGDTVDINLPANVHYRRGQGEQVVLEADEALLPHVRIDDNDIEMDCRMRNRNGERVTITLPGREFRDVGLHGSGTILLEGIDQSELRIDIAGSGQVTASGRADRLEFEIAGSGDGRFANLDARTVDIDIAGSGEAEVAPRERLSVDIAGSGKVTLKTEPQNIDTSIAGSGRIIHPDGTVTRSNGLSRRSRNKDDI